MATRSAIAIKHGDVIKAVYCHWDGYLEHNGTILQECYSDSVKLNQLIALGDISSLGASIGQAHSFDARWTEEDYVKIGDKCLAAPETTFYGRDRGEKNVGFRTFVTEKAFVEFYNGSDYFYLYDHGVWYVKEYDRDFQPLHEALEGVTE